jgi:small subunit ribosomal protein S4
MSGVTGDRLLQLLERRLDNAVYRLGFADSRSQARQIVNHGLIDVNGRRVMTPSFMIKAGDVVTWRENARKTEFFKTISETVGTRTVPAWLSLDSGAMSGSVNMLPEPTDVDTAIDTRLIVEFYSRK